MKLAGSCILKRCGYSKIPDQYALNTYNGSIIVGLKNRLAYQEGMALIRFDVKNAFNATKRKRCLEIMEEDNIEEDLITYFHTVYGPTSDLVMYGPDYKVYIIEASEGLRQGDGPSSYLFCLVVRRVRDGVIQKYPKEESKLDIYSYMDDKTIAVPPEICRCSSTPCHCVLWRKWIWSEYPEVINDLYRWNSSPRRHWSMFWYSDCWQHERFQDAWN